MNRPPQVIPSAVAPVGLPEVVNHTPWPAQYFQHVDPHSEHFHVMVCRTAYDLRNMNLSQPNPPEPVPIDAEDQPPLCEADDCLGEPNASSTVFESDFAPYKPLCDVLLVNAHAYAPAGKPQQRWRVGLSFGRSGQPPSVHKQVQVCGPRHFERGLTGWRLSDPSPATEVPLCYELAAGGPNLVQVRAQLETVEADSAAAAAQRRAAQEALRELPLPHLPNPIGCGLNLAAWVKAQEVLGQRPAWVQAPQVEAPGRGFTGQADYPAVGFGPIGRWWHPRLQRAGTHDQAWKMTQWPKSPLDHDYSYWNCAPDDQQVDYPQGGEIFTLVNLLPGMEVAAFKLPKQPLRLLVRLRAGPMAMAEMNIDTVVVDMAAATLTVVRRACVSAREPIRKLELGSWGDDATLSAGGPDSIVGAAWR